MANTLTGKAKEADVLARTVWGEARGEGALGMQAVINVIMNRYNASLTRYGLTISDVCMKPYQFSCWNPNDPNYAKCQTVDERDSSFKKCLDLASLAVNGNLADITGGANHYHTKAIKPTWADDKKKTVTYGNHIFYKL